MEVIAARPRRRTASLLLGALVVATGCTTAASSSPAVAPAPTTSTTVVVTTTTTAAAPTTASTTTTAPPPPQRVVTEQDWVPFGVVAGITLHHAARFVERVGFHQSNHEGAQQFDVLPTAVAPTTLESRERLTGDRTAADMVVDPTAELRAPVTGTVKRAGTYTLYCRYTDSYLVIAPDFRPEWEVKLLHFEGLAVRAGDRVEAGVTVIGAHARQLPFESQVDEVSPVRPAWPHVHIEVVDPSIPNVPSPGGGC